MSDQSARAALVALDASIAQLQAIRAVLAENIALDIPSEVPSDDTPMTGCKHKNTMPVVTLGAAQTLCTDCGEQLGAGDD